MSANSPDNNNTVDEMVDSLVQEIDNELIHTLEDAKEDPTDQVVNKHDFQLALQDIGEETMDMIVNYNTQVNSDMLTLNNIGDNDDDDSETHSNDSVVVNRVSPSLEEDITRTSDSDDLNISDVAFSPLKRLEDSNLPQQDNIAVNHTSNNSHSSNESSTQEEELYGIGIINLPPLPERKPMFRNSSLAKILDNSLDKESTPGASHNTPPKDFLSVWHSQEPMSSPTISHNSQFTKYTNSTMTSSPPTTTSSRNSAIFKFKPRVISQSKIYQPSSNVSSRVTSGIYSMITTDSIEQELENNQTLFVPYHDHELANTVNLQLPKNKPKLIDVNSEDVSVLDEEFNLENELGFSFDDLFKKLDNIGNDTVESECIVIPDEPVESETLRVLTREVTPEAPIVRRHVSSPFKIRTPKKSSEEVVKETTSIISIEEDIVDETTESEEGDNDEKEILKDEGVFYINVLNLENFKIDGSKHRHAKFALEFKQGNKTIHTTPYKTINHERNVTISKEFGFIINDEFKSFGNNKISINLKVQYDKISKQTIEVVKKVAVKKKFPFGKTRYVYEKSFIDKPVEMDVWSNFMDGNGRFGVCEMEVDGSMLEKMEFDNVKNGLPLVNEFSKGISDPYEVGTLNVEMLYVSRKTNDECIPLQFNKVEKIISKHLHQMDLHKEGYMLQEGGDIIEGTIQRRYFQLHGTTLWACHEMTQHPLISINLLNVDKITSSSQVGDRNFTNFTDIVLFGDHIKLQFFDGEAITLTADTNDNGVLDEWCHTLQEIVSLNVSHQPWVERICSRI